MKNGIKNKLILVFSFVFLLLFIASGCGNNTDGTNDIYDETPLSNSTNANDVNWEFYNHRAEAFVSAIASGDFDEAHNMLDAEMAAVLDVAAVQDIWDGIVTQAGAFLSIHGTDHFEEDGFYFILITSRHEMSGVLMRIALAEDGLVAGWRHLDFPTLEPVENIGFTDYPIVIGAGTDWPLDGMLSMPDNAEGQVPAVVLVHGTGPQDMDSTMFEIRPFRDIAEYLAANGIAVIRYNKRTFTHGTRLPQSFTVWEETIEDAILAAEILRADPRIDENRVFIIGHSMGGMLAPRIHAEGGDFTGLILMAATPRHILELVIEQTRDSIFTAIELGLAEEADLVDMIAEVDQLEDLFGKLTAMSDDVAREMPVPMLGATAYYLKDMAIHPFVDYIQGLTVPVLVMQPGSDFQIRADLDFVLLQELFAGQDEVTFLLYEDLNHSFIPTTATNFIEHAAGMMEPGHVYIPVLQDIVDWILN